MQRQQNLTYAMVATPLHMRVDKTPVRTSVPNPLPTTVRRPHDAHQIGDIEIGTYIKMKDT